MRKQETAETDKINRVIHKALRSMRAPEDLTLCEWADKYLMLSPESSAEPGHYRSSRTPYIKEVMDSFTDPRVRNIVFVAASQVGKSVMEMAALGYIIDQDPGSILYIHPTVEDSKKFSRLRIGPMIRDTKRLSRKVHEVKQGRNNASTVLQKSFPGGMLTITGSNSASALASAPARYIIGDERDRWAASAGREGDPWELAKARQTTFYNAKSIEVSTPTIKGASNIADSFAKGTQEHWCTQCPDCGEWSELQFKDLKFEPRKRKINKKVVWGIKDGVNWACPKCGVVHTEMETRRFKHKWIADNPDAIRKGTRSFWLNAFASPWTSWERIVVRFLESKDNPQQLKVVYNTLFGQLWEERTDFNYDSDDMMSRREDYGAINRQPVEVPDGVLILTMGVDTQDNRFEYEVVGHGMYGETWGIESGIIMGRPDTDEPWKRLDGVIDHEYLRADGSKMKIAICCIDSGGHFTQEVYAACKARQAKKVFAIKGKGGDSVPYVGVPTKVSIGSNRRTCWLYTLGVDSGKATIMSNLRVEEPGPKYCHFPKGKGYDERFFNGLLSEHMVLTSSGGINKWKWEKIPGHERNEALDCRNYALAGFKIINPDMDKLERRSMGAEAPKEEKEHINRQPSRRRRGGFSQFDGW